MTDFTKKFEYVDFWPRVGAYLLDSLLFFGPLGAVSWWIDSFNLSVRWLTPLPYFLSYLVLTFLPTLYFVMRWGGTPAKLILRMRIVDRQARYLGIGRFFRRDLLHCSFIGMQCVMLFLFIQQVDANLASEAKDRISQAYDGHWGTWGQLFPALIMGLLFLADALVLALSVRSRALHDFIAGSYVITKRSYDAIHTPAPAPTAAPTNELPESGLA